MPEYLIKNGIKYNIISDHLGNPLAVWQEGVFDTPVLSRKYDSFGNILEENGDFELIFGFAGGIWDDDTKLVRFGVRDYDSEVGRWTSKEPLGFGGARKLQTQMSNKRYYRSQCNCNFYVYVGNDSINFVDVTGLITKIWIWEKMGGPFSGSKYGHVNISINDYMFDFTGDGFQVYDLGHYLSMQKRNATIVALDLDASQESILEEKLIFHNEHQDYGLFFDWKADE